LKEQVSHLYDEYLLEHYREGHTGKGTAIPTPELPMFTQPVFKSQSSIDLTRYPRRQIRSVLLLSKL